MTEKDHLAHITDEELLRHADGELSNRRAAAIRTHLKACWDCRGRMAAMEDTIAELARSRHLELDHQLPPMDGARSLLRARIARLSGESRPGSWQAILLPRSPFRRVAFVCAALVVAMAIGRTIFRPPARSTKAATLITLDSATSPDRHLTPGATRPVNIRDVCTAQEEVIVNVPTSLRQKVLQEYGIVDARPGDYEIDYLIAPGLGGTEDIRNLWPEPYRTGMWNAHVKDALEERLHDLVCSGQLDLSTAQRDIANDWIAAYKKYFHVKEPLSVNL
jgi:hypothetical protein